MNQKHTKRKEELKKIARGEVGGHTGSEKETEKERKGGKERG